MNLHEDLYQLSLYAFNKVDTPERRTFFSTLLKHSQPFYFQEEGKVLNQLLSTPFSFRFNQQSILGNGIGYVASYPEARGKGGIRQLFQQMLNTAYQKQEAVSLLAPFSQVFYRKFGYENAVRTWTLQWSEKAFSFLQKGKQEVAYTRTTLQKLTSKQEQTLKMIYQTTLGQQQGSLQRPDWWWTYLAEKHPLHCVFLTINGQTCAYMLYQMQGSCFSIFECAYSTIEELSYLLAYAQGHLSSCTSFRYSQAQVEDVCACFADTQYLNIQTSAYMMARIIHFPSLSIHLPKNTATACRLYIADSLLAENNGTWEVQGQTWTKLSSEKLPSIHYEGNIAAWTQIFFAGRPIAQVKQDFTMHFHCHQEHPWLENLCLPALHLYDYF